MTAYLLAVDCTVNEERPVSLGYRENKGRT